ncbi:MAG: hypothetical protein IT359_13755 [Gemmatimonadaceae bacterium]|nr:hypothetical protein [Gemmatimonadaceae bacterium]
MNSNAALIVTAMISLPWVTSVRTGTVAPSYTCASSTSVPSVALKNYAVRLVTASSDTALVAQRVAYGLPSGTANTVSIITTLATCKSAGAAYHSLLYKAGGIAPNRAMVVIKVGNTRYILLDPSEKRGEFQVNVVTDAQWASVAMFTS